MTLFEAYTKYIHRDGVLLEMKASQGVVQAHFGPDDVGRLFLHVPIEGGEKAASAITMLKRLDPPGILEGATGDIPVEVCGYGHQNEEPYLLFRVCPDQEPESLLAHAKQILTMGTQVCLILFRGFIVET